MYFHFFFQFKDKIPSCLRSNVVYVVNAVLPITAKYADI